MSGLDQIIPSKYFRLFSAYELKLLINGDR
jgi:hypothetical protein